MKKRLLSLALVLLMALQLVPTAFAADTTQTLEDGKSYVLTNSAANQILAFLSGPNYTVEYAVYNSDGTVGTYGTGKNSYIPVNAYGKSVVTVQGTVDVTFADGVTCAVSTEPALVTVPLSVNKSYRISNSDTSRAYNLQNNADGYTTYDEVRYTYNGPDNYNKSSSDYATFAINAAASTVITVRDRDMKCWFPYGWRNIITINESSDPALKYYTFAANHSYRITNSNIDNRYSIYSRLDASRNYDVVEYKSDGTEAYREKDFNHGNSLSSLWPKGHTIITVNDYDVTLWFPYEYTKDVTVSESDEPAFAYRTLKAGRNYKVTSSDIDHNAVLSSSADKNRVYDATVYNPNGTLWYTQLNRSTGNFEVAAGGFSVFTIGDYDIDCWVPYEQLKYLTLEESSEPAFAFFTLEAGKHYRLENNNIDSSYSFDNTSDNNRLYNTSAYYKDGTLWFQERDQGRGNKMDVAASGHSVITIGDYDIQFWLPYRWLKAISVYEVGEPALFEFNLSAGETFTFRNSNIDRSYTVQNTSDNNRLFSSGTSFWNNGYSIDLNNYHGDLVVNPGSYITVTVGDYDIIGWLPTEYYSTYVTLENSAGRVLQKQAYPEKRSPISPEANVTNAQGVLEFIYDSVDPGADVVLPVETLETVKDAASAGNAVKVLTDSMTQEQKDSATGTDLATLYAEAAAMKAASAAVTGKEIIISKATVSPLMEKAGSAVETVDNMLASGGITTARAMANTVLLTTQETGEITIKVDPDVLETKVDKVRIETPTYAVTLKISDLEEDLTDVLVIKTSGSRGGSIYDIPSTWAPAPLGNMFFRRPQPTETSLFAGAGSTGSSVVTVTLPGEGLSSPLTVSFPSTGEELEETVVDSKNNASTSKFNPATATLDGKITESGTYTTKVNAKDFTDIQDKSVEMQEAIRFLASKGIITGKSATEFAPDESINRAQIATLIIKALGKLDSTAKSTFKDVPAGIWYEGAVASCAKYGLITGRDKKTFAGLATIMKQEILTIASRVLTQEMGYKAPASTKPYLSRYSDTIEEWAQPYAALTTRENLVVYRVDGTFSGRMEMTRGDVAIIIYRLFQRIW